MSLFIVMLSVIMVNVVMLSAILVNVIILSVIMLNAVVLRDAECLTLEGSYLSYEYWTNAIPYSQQRH